MYKIVHRNGSGGLLSRRYTDHDSIASLEEAKELARQFRAEHPASDGWYQMVDVIDDTDKAIWSPDFEELFNV